MKTFDIARSPGSRAIVRLLGLAAVLFLSPVNPERVYAQAGHTGGSIGKQEKSMSGQEQSQPRRARQESPAQNAKKVEQPARSTGPRVFENPTINGIRVDRCMKWGPKGCGAPAADYWCRSKGFTRAIDTASKDGPPTIFQDPASSVKVCDYFFCGGFSRIVCE